MVNKRKRLSFGSPADWKSIENLRYGRLQYYKSYYKSALPAYLPAGHRPALRSFVRSGPILGKQSTLLRCLSGL